MLTYVSLKVVRLCLSSSGPSTAVRVRGLTVWGQVSLARSLACARALSLFLSLSLSLTHTHTHTHTVVLIGRGVLTVWGQVHNDADALVSAVT